MIPRILRASLTALLLATAVMGAAAIAHAQTPTAVTTFHAIGIYWKPVDGGGVPVGSSTNVCRMEYKPNGSSTWIEGMPLWFDDNVSPDASPLKDVARIHEYRGSIVDLEPNTQYDLRVTLQSAPFTSVTFTATTMNENFSVGTTTPVNSGSTTLNITTGGSPGAYAVYDGGGTAVIDVNNLADTCITVNASWVIVRGVILRGARLHGIELKDVTNVVIEGCDISGWGSFKKLADGITNSALGEDGNAGIYAKSGVLEHVVIQRNKIHDPRTRANSWHTIYLLGQPGGPPASGHPQGPMGINFLGRGSDPDLFKGTAGHHIIRYNEIWSTDGVGDVDHPGAGHGFDDGIGGDNNTAFLGFPGRDSDIYGNYVANCWDDAVEVEGGGMNVRVWGNFVEYTFQGYAYAGNVLGPLYSFRNLVGFARYDPLNPDITTDDISIRPTEDASGNYIVPYQYASPYPEGGGMFKLGHTAVNSVRGRAYLLHNTSLQPDYTLISNPSITRPGGVNAAFGTGGSRQFRYFYSRNNILHVKTSAGTSVNLTGSTLNHPTNDLDYDFANGVLNAGADDELNAIIGAPVYASGPTPRAPEQAPGSLGLDTAVVLSNFSRFFNQGAGPDIGAVEAGKGAMTFGVSANWTTFLGSSGGGNSVPNITTTSLPNATIGAAYSQTLAATGGDGALTWTLDSGSLPAGLSLSSSGVISGAPTVDGVSNFTVRVADADGVTGPADEDTQALTITVVPANDTLGAINPPMTVTMSNTYTFAVPYGASSTGELNRKINVTLRNSNNQIKAGPVNVTLPSAAAGSVNVSITIPTGLTPASNYKWRIKLDHADGSNIVQKTITGVTVQ